MDPVLVSIIVSALGFAVTVITLSVTTSWRLRTEISNLQSGFSKELSLIQTALTRELALHQTADDEQFAIVRREFGETVTAIRYGLSQIELTVTKKTSEIEVQHRDLFIRRESFLEVVRSVREETAGVRSDLRDLIRRTDQHLAAITGVISARLQASEEQNRTAE